MKQGNQIIATSVLVFSFMYGSVFAGASETNTLPMRVAMPTKIEAITHSMADAEKLWRGNPEAYFQTMQKNAKYLWQLDVALDNDYQTLFGSFTNMLNKPISIDDERAYEMLSLQSYCVKEYTRNDRIRNDKKTWLAIAKYIGGIRSQIIPNYVGKGYLNPPGALGASSPEERDRIVAENRRNVERDNYQTTLRSENRSLTMRLLAHMGDLSTQGEKDRVYFQQLVDLANLTEEEIRTGDPQPPLSSRHSWPPQEKPKKETSK